MSFRFLCILFNMLFRASISLSLIPLRSSSLVWAMTGSALIKSSLPFWLNTTLFTLWSSWSVTLTTRFFFSSVSIIFVTLVLSFPQYSAISFWDIPSFFHTGPRSIDWSRDISRPYLWEFFTNLFVDSLWTWPINIPKVISFSNFFSFGTIKINLK